MYKHILIATDGSDVEALPDVVALFGTPNGRGPLSKFPCASGTRAKPTPTGEVDVVSLAMMSPPTSDALDRRRQDALWGHNAELMV
jgi:hypothetical protein